MLTSTGVVKLVDFGTCKDLVDPSRNGPEFVGTPDYMSPEVIDGGAATAASDLWALGCMLYQCGAGRTPFKAPSDYLTLRRVQTMDWCVPPGMSGELAHLVSSLLQRDPAARLGCTDPAAPTFAAIRAHPFFQHAHVARTPTLRWLALQATARFVQSCVTASAPPAAVPAGDAAPGGPASAAPAPAPDTAAPATPGSLSAPACAVAACPPEARGALARVLELRSCLHAPGMLAGVLGLPPEGPTRFMLVGAPPFDPRGVLGLSRDVHGVWSSPSTVVCVSLGPAGAYGPGSASLGRLVAAVEAVNSARPLPTVVLLSRPSADTDMTSDRVLASLHALHPGVTVVPLPNAARSLNVPRVGWRGPVPAAVRGG